MNSARTRTLIFDCDGVLADTERFGHLPAFNEAFETVGVSMHWTEADYAELLRIGGGKERIAAAMKASSMFETSEPPPSLISKIHRVKTDIYRAMVSSGVLPPRVGVSRLIQDALASGWKVAIASTSAPESVESVLESVVGSATASDIPIFAGDAVPAKKPSPDIYLLTLAELGVTADDAVVIEDSAIGLQAAVSAGITCVVTPSSYTQTDDFTSAAAVLSSLGEPDEPLQVIVDPHRIGFGSAVTLDSLDRLVAKNKAAASIKNSERTDELS